MSRKKRRDKRSTRNPSLKLPISGETIFIKKAKPINPGDTGSMFIDRMYAQGGFVIVQILNYTTNKMQKKMLDPSDAVQRLNAILQGFPPQYVPDGFREAVIKAVIAAKRQTLEGENELYKQNLDIDDLTEQLKADIKAERELDPELDKEMRIIELANKH